MTFWHINPSQFGLSPATPLQHHKSLTAPQKSSCHHVAYVGNPEHVMTYWWQASPFHLIPLLHLLYGEKTGRNSWGTGRVGSRCPLPGQYGQGGLRVITFQWRSLHQGTCNHFTTEHYTAWRLQAAREEYRELSYWSDSMCFLLIWKYKGNLLNYADGKQINTGEGWMFTKAGQGHSVN